MIGLLSKIGPGLASKEDTRQKTITERQRSFMLLVESMYL